jgi:hypothetical protein
MFSYFNHLSVHINCLFHVCKSWHSCPGCWHCLSLPSIQMLIFLSVYIWLSVPSTQVLVLLPCDCVTKTFSYLRSTQLEFLCIFYIYFLESCVIIWVCDHTLYISVVPVDCCFRIWTFLALCSLTLQLKKFVRPALCFVAYTSPLDAIRMWFTTTWPFYCKLAVPTLFLFI